MPAAMAGRLTPYTPSVSTNTFNVAAVPPAIAADSAAFGAAAWACTAAEGGKLKNLVRQNAICVPGRETARVQEAHIFIGHWLCEEIDRRFAAR